MTPAQRRVLEDLAVRGQLEGLVLNLPAVRACRRRGWVDLVSRGANMRGNVYRISALGRAILFKERT